MSAKSFLRLPSPQRLNMTLQWSVKDKCFAAFRKSKLRNTTFSLISNSCLAGSVYHMYGLQFNSPTVGTFFYSDDYLRMLEDFRHYIAEPLVLKDESIHPEVNELITKTHKFPVGVLGGDVEIMFLHYASKDEAEIKWARRVKRINFDNLFIFFTDSGAAGGGAGNNDFKDEYLERFEALPFENKVMFSKNPLPGEHVIQIKDSDPHYPWVENMVYNRKFEKYMDLTAWFNEGKLEQASPAKV
jgi:uncharacterized protein (DUF1919 family)